MKVLAVAVTVITILLLTAVVMYQRSPTIHCPDFAEDTIVIGENRIRVAVAHSAAEKQLGLSGCDHVPAQTGVLFPFEKNAYPSFWMKDMLIAIDIVWIRDGEVVGIEHNVQPPTSEDDELTLYRPPVPVSDVLELAAGEAERLEIQVGVSMQSQ